MRLLQKEQLPKIPTQTETIFVECFRFLRAMACKNIEAQHRLVYCKEDIYLYFYVILNMISALLDYTAEWETY